MLGLPWLLEIFLLLLYLLWIHLFPWCQLICNGSCTGSFGFSDLYSTPGHVACLCIWHFWGESPTAYRKSPPAFFQARRICWLGNEEGILIHWNMEPESCISRMFSGHVLMESNHVSSGKANRLLVYVEIAISSLAALSRRPFPSPLFWMSSVFIVYCMFILKPPTG